MRARTIAAVVTLLVSVGCFTLFSTSATARLGQPTTTAPPPSVPVEVAGKVLERGAPKVLADATDLPRTGSQHAPMLLLAGLALAGLGLVLIHVGQLRCARPRRCFGWTSRATR